MNIVFIGREKKSSLEQCNGMKINLLGTASANVIYRLRKSVFFLSHASLFGHTSVVLFKTDKIELWNWFCSHCFWDSFSHAKLLYCCAVTQLDAFSGNLGKKKKQTNSKSNVQAPFAISNNLFNQVPISWCGVKI